jgi:hypothetical protein
MVGIPRSNKAVARADCLEAEAARARALLHRLESAILAKAFRGELVPQDPNDEPASVLLERIRAETQPPRALIWVNAAWATLQYAATPSHH